MLPCRFCDNHAVAICAQRVERWQLTFAVDLRVDVQVRRVTGVPRASVAIVTDINWYSDSCYGQITLFIKRVNGTNGLKDIQVSTGSPFMALRPAECGVPVCEAHRIERGEKHSLCLTHWNAWETDDGSLAKRV